MATASTSAPQTLEGKVLIGWMERDIAVRYLMTSCAFDHAITEAEALWIPYRDRCEALPEREAKAPSRLPLGHEERQHATRFLNALAQMGPHTIQDVIKIDLSQLVVHQLYVACGHSNQNYVNQVRSTAGWLQHALPLAPRSAAQIRTNFMVNGLHTAADIDVPHAEFIFAPDPTGSFFSVQQFQSYISVMMGQSTFANRMMLKAGYHRSFARALSMIPTATVPSAVVALERNSFGAPPNQVVGAGLTVATAGLRAGPTGCRPAIFSDFFNDELAMRVNLRRKRYQLQMRCTWVEIDA